MILTCFLFFLQALELLTGCYILVQGNTVASMGTHKGLKQLRRIIIDCMKNIHPIYHIKELMIKRELSKDPKLSHESWDRFLPHFRKHVNNAANKKAKKSDKKPDAKDINSSSTKKKKEYTPFPPAQQPSKVDLAIESGEYFMSASQKKFKKIEERKSRERKVKENKKREREELYIAPEEKKLKVKRKYDVSSDF